MKKFFPVIIGLFIGISLSFIMINFGKEEVAYSSINWKDEAVAAIDTFSWKEVFGNNKGKDLYMLMYRKLLDAPESDALKDTAQKYGLTKDEAQRVIDGSITPIFNNPKRNSANLSQEDALKMASKLQEDFALLLEMYSLQQEIDTSIAPSEIFANGELLDSGFDLIYDLTIIEEILFLEKTENSVGDPFGDQLDSPYLPTQLDQTLEDYVPDEGPIAWTSNESALTIEPPKEGEETPTGSLAIGDEKVDVAVLKEDVCPTDNPLADALGAYEEEKGQDGGDGSGDGGGDGGGGDDGGDGGGGGGGGDGEEEGGDENAAEKELKPAPADEWRKAWCPNMGAPQTGAGAGNTFGDAGFTSLGGVVNSLIDQATGASAAFSEGGLSAYISVCFETSFIKQTYVSYQPGDSCVLCEVNRINENMNKTLNHSLVPNKATGNLMESAKCKESGLLLNFQFIAMSAPVPTEPNDDIIFGKNIFAEWKSFADRYQPFLGFDASPEVSGEFDLQYAPANTTQEDIFNSVKAITLQKKNEALQEIEKQKKGNDGTNIALYVQTILKEINSMNSFFDGYLTLYGKINKELGYFKEKESK